MNTAGRLKHCFEVPDGRIGELVATTLPETGWTITNFNEALCTAAATRKHSSESFGIFWQYEFKARIHWEPASKGYAMVVEVQDSDNKATTDQCKQLCSEFFHLVVKNIERLKANPLPFRKTYGGARWAAVNDLEAAGYVIDDAAFNDCSLLVGPAGDGKVIAIPPALTSMHSIVCGPTGSGKTSFLVAQAVRRLKTSGIFAEATDGTEMPHLYGMTARWRHEQGGQDIYYFNPNDVTSNQINLVTLIKRPEDAGRIAKLVVKNTATTAKPVGDPFWEAAESYILNALLIHAAGQKSNLATVRRLVQMGARALHEEMSNSFYQRARDEYQGFLNTGTEVTRNSVFIGLLQRLWPWTYPVVEKVTERNDFDIEGLSRRLFSFYFAIKADMNDIKPVNALVLDYLLDVALLQPEHPLMLVLDEFTNFGRIPSFTDKLSIIRHRGIGVTLGFQDISQVDEMYGKNGVEFIMSQPGTKIFLRPRNPKTAQEISNALGTKTHYERKINSSGNIQEFETGVPLLNPADVLALDFQKAILFSPLDRPVLIDRWPKGAFDYATSLPVWERRKLSVQEQLVPAGTMAPPFVHSETPVQEKRVERYDPAHDERAPEF